jgi:hypothetical protein
MTPPTFQDSGDTFRTGGPVTCAACGCRLRPDARDSGKAWFHFSPLGGRDARGCRIDCAELAHDASGQVTADVAAA